VDFALLCFFAFLAGLVDSVVGGGGLVQLPALFVLLPAPLAASVPTVFGTNKLSSICGTAVAAAQYARKVEIPWGPVLPAALTAFVFSALGARCVQMLRGEFLKPLVLVLMIVVLIYTWLRKDFGNLHAPKLTARREVLAAIAVGMVIGFYDGFFGPGTGSFLMFIFVGVFGFDFLTATAGAKVINLATNIAAVAAFALGGHVLYEYALPMGACNVAGALVGTRLAVLKGNRFVRVFFLCVVTVMIGRFAWELFWKRG
jgi:uncharacterized membrane protein YfcA